MLMTILIPSVMIFAPTFTVIKLARSNEILPIAACGTSLRRMSAPFIVAAILATLSMASLDEWIMPLVGDKIIETDNKFSVKNMRSNVQDYDGNTKLWAATWDLKDQLLTGGDQVNVRFTLLDVDKHMVEVVTARRARWDGQLKRWVAYDGFIDKPKEVKREPGQKPRPWKEPIPPEGYVIES